MRESLRQSSLHRERATATKPDEDAGRGGFGDVIDPSATPIATSSAVPLDLGRRMAKGAAWMIALRIAVRGVGVVSMIILARLLVPADFGLVAIATALAGALAAMSEFGFQVALIQNQAADRRLYDTAWTLGLIRGFVVAGALAIAAGPLAVMFSDPRLEPILLLLAGSAIVLAFENIGVVDFRKDLHFQREFLYRALSKVASFAITVPLAIILRNYWALVVGIVAGQLAGVLLSYTMCAYRPRLSLSDWRELLRFSKWLLLSNMLFFAYHRVDTFVIGRFAGAQPLGFYRLAYEIASLPTSEMVAPIRAAILPGYAKLAIDRERLRAGFAATFGTIVIVAIPVAVGLGLTADPLVRLLLGERWLDAIPLLEVLCIAGVINVCTANTWPVFLALGRPWITTALMALGVVLLVPLLLWSVPVAGAMGAAWALVAVAGVVLAGNLLATLRLLRLSGVQLLAQTWRTVVAVVAMSGAIVVVEALSPQPERLFDTALLLACSVVTGAAAYLVSLWVLWRLTGLKVGPEQTAIWILRKSLSRVSARFTLSGG
ncbi:MAG: lipopolysaccharide biosynthesis protein [Geminicoccaceae bacterium]